MTRLPQLAPIPSDPPDLTLLPGKGPVSITDGGTLLLWFSTARAMGRTLTALRLAERSYSLEESCARIRLDEGAAPACLALLVAALSGKEARQTRALFVAGTAAPKFSDFGGVLSLRALDVRARSGNLIDQLAEGRFTSYFHPIVEARAPHKVFAHEALLRGYTRDGTLQPPEPLFALAREAGLLLELDTAACRTAIRAAVRHAPNACVFINFSPAAVDDPQEHLTALQDAMAEAGLSRESVVFEVVEADRLGDLTRLERILEGYRAAGFRFALDDLGAGWSSLNLVHRLLPDFIKLDRDLVHGVHKNKVKGAIAGKLLELCKELGIASIVEGVEDEGELQWVSEHGADYVQGFLFGRPSEVPPEFAPKHAAVA